jgi:hypothetical protein
VAHVLRELGIHLGDDLNYALDNLWFTLMFRRPALLQRPASEIEDGIRLFAAAMQGRWQPDERQAAFLEAARLDTEEQLRARRPDRDPAQWTRARLESLEEASGPAPDQIGWGWKEPCAYVFLEPLAAAHEGLRYIHVIRDGPELARKPLTHFQLALWGPFFGMTPPADPTGFKPDLGLRFWARSNSWVLERGRNLLGDRFLPLRYETLCEEPRQAIEGIASFAGVDAGPAQIDPIADFVRPAPESQRDRARDAADFDAEDLAIAQDIAAMTTSG